MKKKAVIVVRTIMGLIFFVFGLNGFFHFIPIPEMTPEAGALMGAFAQTGYFFPMLKVVEITGGLLLISGYFVPLGLLLLAPVVVNIFVFHAFLDMSGMPMAAFLVLAELFLGCAYCGAFKHVLQAKTDISC